MMRYKCIVAYDGTGFSGYQVQPGKRTVQGELEAALGRIHKGQGIKVYASGRTDATVHAKGQVIHFDSELAIPVERWSIALNSLLPDDISILETAQTAPDFHARFDVKKKEYRYFIDPSPARDVFKRNYAYHYPYSLNLDDIQAAMELLKGTHDFTSFCAAKTEVEDKVRTIYEMDLAAEEGLLVFRFSGSGFLYNMVRIMTGTLLEIGQGLRNPCEIKNILEGKNRSLAGKTAPGHGLYLWKVDYDN